MPGWHTRGSRRTRRRGSTRKKSGTARSPAAPRAPAPSAARTHIYAGGQDLACALSAPRPVGRVQGVFDGQVKCAEPADCTCKPSVKNCQDLDLERTPLCSCSQQHDTSVRWQAMPKRPGGQWQKPLWQAPTSLQLLTHGYWPQNGPVWGSEQSFPCGDEPKVWLQTTAFLNDDHM